MGFEPRGIAQSIFRVLLSFLCARVLPMRRWSGICRGSCPRMTGYLPRSFTVNRSIAPRPNDRITLAIGRLTYNYPANYRRLTGPFDQPMGIGRVIATPDGIQR